MKELKVGDKAPSFAELEANKGKTVVIYFYPKDFTPGCTQEACEFRDAYDKLRRRSVVVLGVSPDSAASHAKFAAEHKLPFTLVADEDHRICEAYGVWKEKSMYGKKYMGVERSTFIVGPDGRLTKIWRKVKPQGHAEEVLTALAG